jgi:hypothetical protein
MWLNQPKPGHRKLPSFLRHFAQFSHVKDLTPNNSETLRQIIPKATP